MLLIPDPEHRGHRPVPQHTTLNINCFVRDPVTGESLHAATRATSRRRPRTYLRVDRHRRHRVLRPRSRVLHLRLRALRPEPVLGLLLPRLGRGRVELRARRELDGAPNLGVQAAVQGGLLPGPADGPVPGPALRDDARRWSRSASTIEVQHHEVGTAGQAEIDMRFDTLRRMADKLMLYKYVVKNVARAARQDASRSCRSRSSRTTARACTCTSRCGRAASRCSSTRRATPACPTWRAGTSAGCSQHAPAILAFANPTTNSYKRLVPGLRGAGQPRVLAAQPLGVGAHPAVLEEPEGEAARVPLPRPVVQPVPRVLGDAHGRPRRHPEPHRAAARRSTRTSTTCRPRSWPRCRRCRARSTRRSTALEADHEFLLDGRRVHARRDRDVDRRTSARHEIDAVRLRPHPWEFYLYYDI